MAREIRKQLDQTSQGDSALVQGGVTRRAPRKSVVLAAFLVLALLFVAGCKTEATIDITMDSSGDGTIAVTVTLDKEAAEAAGDLSQQLSFDDLKKAGWSIAGPEDAGDGGVYITATHAFANVQQATALMKSITGNDGPLRDFVLTRTASTWDTQVTARGNIDLSKGVDSFNDPKLAKALGGTNLSTLITKLNNGAPVDPESLLMSVQVNATGMKVADPESAAVSASLGDAPVKLNYVGKKQHIRPYVLIGLAVLVGIAAIWLLFFDRMPFTRKTRAARRRRRRRRQHHSARHGWDIVEGRTGVEAPPEKISKAPKSRSSGRGKHGRRRSSSGLSRPPQASPPTGSPSSGPTSSAGGGNRFPLDDWQPDL